MKKILIIIMVSFTLLLTACSNSETTSKNSGEPTVAREQVSEELENSDGSDQTTEEMDEPVEDTSENNEDVVINTPTSDVSNGTDIQGTWVCETEKDNSHITLVLALNSDSTFEFYEDISGNTSGSALGNGTYTTNNSTLLFTFNNTEDNIESENFVAVFQENTNFIYSLKGDKLILKSNDGTSYEFTRE